MVYQLRCRAFTGEIRLSGTLTRGVDQFAR